MHIHPNDLRMESFVETLRNNLGVPYDIILDPIDVLRRAKLARLIAGFEFVEDHQLGRDDAKWDSATNHIYVKRTVAERAEAGGPEDAFTIVHEIGHAVLRHPPRNRRHGGAYQVGRHIEFDEDEANWFARTFMAPGYLADISQTTTVDEFAGRFGLPESQAVPRLDELKRRQRRRLGLNRNLAVGSHDARKAEIDTGNYDEAFPEMLRNAMRWNSTD